LKNEFKPIKVAVDFSNRLYVILKDENGGFVQLEKDGTFSGFFGATLTKPSIADAFSKLISTKEQRLRTQRAVPTRYSGVTIDNSGFVFGTIGNANLTSGFDPNNFVRKLNPSGNDILKRNGIIPIFGDSDMLEVEGKKVFSDLCDIVALPSGIFSVLGQQYGRIYTYNGSGDLMFVFGGLGDSKGQFGLPVALDVIDNNKYLVLDNKYNQILLFEPTEYALAVTKATILYENREYDKAKELWETVLKYTTKSELAFTGVGKSLLRDGEYSKAMEYFYLSNNKGFFSEAYKNYRKDVMKKNFGIYMSVILVLIILFVIGIKIYKKTKRVKDYA
jgi:tetratricopeptide (TPR) repeat protein